jgi:mRNA interferase MazF
MTRDAGLRVLTRVLGVPATGTVRGIPTEVALGLDDGMPAECALTVDNLALIYKLYLTRWITTLREDRLIEVCAALSVAIAC